MKLFAVIPTIGERNETLVPMCAQLRADGVEIIILHNESFSSWAGAGLRGLGRVHYIQHVWLMDEPVNLSRLWNIGLNKAEALAGGEEFVVAVFNDDLTLPPGIVQALADGITTVDAAASYVLPYGTVARFHEPNEPLTLGNRMVGYAFALLGSKKLRADEDFLWWWGDTDLDIRARAAGGVVGLPIWGLQHHDPNGYTNRRPELTAQAGRDRETFVRKWGGAPW